MTFTGSGAREKRKSAAAALAEATPLLTGVSGLSQAEKVQRLTQARDLVSQAADDLDEAVEMASSVEEEAPASEAASSDSGNAVADALRALAKALGITL